MKELKNRSILYLIHRYADFQKDQIIELSEYFRKVYVIVRYKPVAELSKIPSMTSLKMHSLKYSVQLDNTPDNVSVFLSPVLYLPTNTGYQRLGDKHYKSVLKTIKKHQIEFDIIHAHFAWTAGFVGMRLKTEFRKPFILTTHGYDIYDLPFRSDKWKTLIKEVINSADINITVNKKNVHYYEKIGIVNKFIKIIPNGYNNKLFFPLPRNKVRSILNISNDKKIILAVGHIEYVKGHYLLIKAMKILKNQNIQCIVIGEGFLRKKLIKKVKKHDLKDEITFIGPKLHREINLWMNACDLFVLPSLSESFGIVQLESMACGKPVVSTLNEGSMAIIKSSDYGLLSKKNSEDLADKIALALEKKWDTDKIINYANQFSWKEVCMQIFKIYQNII